MNIIITVLTVLTIVNSISALLVQNPVVKTKSGSVRGKLVQGARQDVYEFTGIPFAEPPVGNLRFKKPVPKTPWGDTVLDATQLTKSCLQVVTGASDDYAKYLQNMTLTGVKESEDCLYLNIWVPKTTLDTLASGKKLSKQLSVYVFIHGGSFVSGSTMMNLYSGAVMSGYDNIIFASIQYRLGSLGFAYFGPNSDAPGNAGLWDQLEALKWISENIGAFGGNSSEVTIGGQSAGAAAVTFHLISPYSRKYFHRAIVESGSALAQWAVHSPELAGMITSIVLNQTSPTCGTSVAQQIECLRSAPAAAIAQADGLPMLMGNSGPVPVIDGDFVPRDPRAMLLAGDIYNVPLLIGANRDEGSMNILSVPDATQLLPNCANPKASLGVLNFTHYDSFMQTFSYFIVAGMSLPFDISPALTKAVETHYWPDRCPGGYPVGPDVLQAVVQAVGDYSITCPTYAWAKTASTLPKAPPIYAYQFTQPASTRFLPKWMGAYHILEMTYAHGEPFSNYAKNYGYRQDDKLLSQSLMEYWGNFIKYGNPNFRDRQYLSYDRYWDNGLRLGNWPPFVGKRCQQQIVDLNLMTTTYNYNDAVLCSFKARECAFWDEFFPLFVQLFSTGSTA